MTTIEDDLRAALTARADQATRSFNLNDVVDSTLVSVVPSRPTLRRRRPIVLAALGTAAAVIAAAAIVATTRHQTRIDVGKNPQTTSTSSSNAPQSTTPSPTSATSAAATTSPTTRTTPETFKPVRFDPASLPSGWSVSHASDYAHAALPPGLTGDTLLITATRNDGRATLQISATRTLTMWVFGNDPRGEGSQTTIHGFKANAAVYEVPGTGYLSWTEGDISVSVVLTTKERPTVESLRALGEKLVISQQQPYASVGGLTDFRATYEGRPAENLPSYELSIIREQLSNPQDDAISIRVGSIAPTLDAYVPPISRAEERKGRLLEIVDDIGAPLTTVPGDAQQTRRIRFREGDTLVRLEGSVPLEDLLQIASELNVTDEATFVAHTKGVIVTPGPAPQPPFDLTRPGVVRVRGEQDGVRWTLLADPARPDGSYPCVIGVGFGGCIITEIAPTPEFPFVAGPAWVQPTEGRASGIFYGLARPDVASVRLTTSGGRTVSSAPTVAPLLGQPRGFAAIVTTAASLGPLTLTALAADGTPLGRPAAVSTEEIDRQLTSQQPVDLSTVLVPWGPVVQEGTVEGQPWKLHGAVQIGGRLCATVEFAGSGGGRTGNGPDVCEWDRGNFGDPPRPAPGIQYADIVEPRRRFIGVVVDADIATVRFELTSGNVEAKVAAGNSAMRIAAVGIPKSATLTAVVAIRADGTVAGRMETNVAGELTQEYILPSKYTLWYHPTCLSANAPIARVMEANGQPVTYCPTA
jgi:hypothetical protein